MRKFVDVMADVLAKEHTCRIMLSELVAEGVEILHDDKPIVIRELTHQECIDLILGIYKGLNTREALGEKNEKTDSADKRQTGKWKNYDH